MSLPTGKDAAGRAGGGAARTAVIALDRRLPLMEAGQKFLRKAFPDHWSFLLGEMALYSFVVLVLTGTFLTLFFDASMVEHRYAGSYLPLRGAVMSYAYSSTVDLGFDVRGGLLVRQVHHWAALVFVAAIACHLLRIFFTGAFRRPREVNWLIGVTLFGLALLEGFCGYSLPDDLLSGTGLRTAQGIVLSLPVLGSYLSFFIWRGGFPGHAIIERLYVCHVLLLPGVLVALVTAHLSLVVYLKHTQWAEPGRKNRNVVGKPLFAAYTTKSIGLFLGLFGVLAVLGAAVQINPVWEFGPFRPDQASSDAQPDWYVGFLEGALRLMPQAETRLWGHTLEWGVFLPGAALPTALFLLLYGYPFFERWITGDTGEHHLCDRPRNQPIRTGLGAAAVAEYAVLLLAGGQDVLAKVFGAPVNALTYGFRVCFFVLPVAAFWAAKRLCLGLQAQDRLRLAEGDAGGALRRTARGGYQEGHRPVPSGEVMMLLARDMPRRLVIARPELATRRDRLRTALSGWYLRDRVELPMSEREREQVAAVTEQPPQSG